jgi:2-dehydropantoate 2-reductase
LAKYYKANEEIEVIFIARNESKRKILQDGLTVESIDGDFTVKPSIVSDDKTEIGDLDVLLVCVKSYGLEKAINHYKHNVKKGGVVITIQNLVNQVERVEKLLPEGITLLHGCAYIISNILDPGYIKHKGGPATLFFGNDTNTENYTWIEDLFLKAGIKATLSDSISKIIWKKFLFISPLAVATSYFSCTIGTLRSDTEKYSFFKSLIKELLELIKAKNIDLNQRDMDNHLQSLKGFPKEGKTSMQLDIENNNPSEIDSLLDYVLIEAKKHNLKLNNYSIAFDKLKTIKSETT